MHSNRIAAPRLYASIVATNLSNIGLLISRTTDKQHLLTDRPLHCQLENS